MVERRTGVRALSRFLEGRKVAGMNPPRTWTQSYPGGRDRPGSRWTGSGCGNPLPDGVLYLEPTPDPTSRAERPSSRWRRRRARPPPPGRRREDSPWSMPASLRSLYPPREDGGGCHTAEWKMGQTPVLRGSWSRQKGAQCGTRRRSSLGGYSVRSDAGMDHGESSRRRPGRGGRARRLRHLLLGLSAREVTSGVYERAPSAPLRHRTSAPSAERLMLPTGAVGTGPHAGSPPDRGDRSSWDRQEMGRRATTSLERTTGFEPATPTLARWCSTN